VNDLQSLGWLDGLQDAVWLLDEANQRLLQAHACAPRLPWLPSAARRSLCNDGIADVLCDDQRMGDIADLFATARQWDTRSPCQCTSGELVADGPD